MENLNFLSKSGSQSRSHSVVTLASTVGSPSVHRRGTMLKLISVLVLILTVGVGNVWGDPATSNFTNNSLGVGTGEPTWNTTVNATGFESSSYARGVTWGSGKDPVLTSSSITGTITKVSIVASTNAGASKVSLSVSVGGTAFSPASQYVSSGTASCNQSYEFTGSATGTVSVSLTNTVSDKTAWIKSITITYIAADPATIYLNAEGGTCQYNSRTEESAGDGITLPSASPSSSCASQNWIFAGWAKTAITETTTEPTLYTGSYTPVNGETLHAVYKKTESSGGSSSGSQTFTFSSIASTNNWENGVAYTSVVLDPVTIQAQGGGNNGKWYTSSGGSWRAYSGGTVSISVANGSVTSVTSSPSCSFTISNGTASFSPSARTDFTQIVVNYTATGASVTTYNSNPNCCTELGSINGSISVNNPTSVTLTWSAVTGAEKYQVKVPGSSSHNAWTDVNSTSVTVTKSCGTAYTAYFRAIDTNGTHCAVGPESSLAIPAKSYTVTTTGVTHATPNTAWPSTTCGNFDRTLTVETGYDFPNALTVAGADYTWVKGSGLLTIKNVIGDVSITLTPTAHNYTITYENMDGATNDANNPGTYKITDSDISLGDPTKEGYTFEGWFTNSDLAENHRVTGVAIATGSHEDKTFYAKWVQKVTLTKASASHGSFVLSSSNTGSPEISSVYTNNAAQTVYVVCTPADGYQVNEVSQSGIYSGVTIGGSGNARTIEYAQGANGSSEVSVSFSCVNPSISVHPASANYAQNAEATALTVTASANNASLGYLWQSSSNNSDWSPAAGTNNQQTYTPSTATANTTYYRVIVTNNASGCGSSTPSNAATITVSASVCADPTFSVSGGTYNANQSVEISCATGGAIIRYTTDGNDPTESSPVYSSAISITQTTTLKAKAFKSEWTASNITSATYTLKCAAPTFNKGTNTYLGAQSITLSCTTEGAKIYYTMDGSAPSSTNGTEYTAAITVSSNQTIKAIAVKDGWSDSDIDFATYTIQYTVTWNDNSGQIHSQAVTYGSNEYSCPSDPSLDDNCGSKFMGWTTNSTYKGNSAPADLFTDTSGTKPTITGDTDFYAVFADYAN